MALRMALHEPAASQNPGPKEQHIPQGSPPRVRARRVAASLSKVPTWLGANTLPCWLLSPCGFWKSHEEAGIREQRFNHSFPRTFSSKQGLHHSACSLIFPPPLNPFLLSISRQTTQPRAGAEQKSLQAASPSLLSISSLHQGKLRQGKNERARGKAEECQPKPGKRRHHPLHVSKDDSSEEMTIAEPKANPSLAAATFLPPLPQGKGTGLSLALLQEGGMHPPALGAG